MNALAATHAQRIRELHGMAQGAAQSAIEFALQAGLLLTEVKEALPHGEFGPWVQTYCGFTDRTARRYMRLHAHRDVLPTGAGVRESLEHVKADTVAEMLRPAWLPAAPAAVAFSDGRGRTWFAWALDYVAFNGERQDRYACAFSLTDDNSGGHFAEYLQRGIRFDRLGDVLKGFGLRDPSTAAWSLIDSDEPVAYHRMCVELDTGVHA